MNEFTGEFAKKVDSDRRVNVIGEKTSQIPLGAEAKKYFADILIERGEKKRRIGQMVIREQDSGFEKDPNTQPKVVLDKYHFLKKLGLPVVPSLRYDSENKRYLMTDLTEGGRKLVFNTNHPLNLYRLYRDQNFEVENLAELEKEIVNIAEKAYAQGNGVCLSEQSYAIVVDSETGIGEVRLLDIFSATHRLKNGKSVHDKYPMEFDAEDNEWAAKNFISSRLRDLPKD